MITLDEKYSLLINELTVLNSKLSSFINGDANTIVVTDSGPIKSLAGIVRDLKQFRFVQKVIDHRLYADVLLDSVNIEVGMLVRVWGDTTLINGLYKKNNTGYNKVSYADLYNLGSLPI